MKFIQKHFHAIVILFLIIGANWFMRSASRVEEVYSRGLYPYITFMQRKSLGWIPISIGDLVYIAFLILLIIVVIRLIKSFAKSANKLNFLKGTGISIVVFFSWIWIVFHFLWGFNYYRSSIASQFRLKEEAPTQQGLRELTSVLLDETNRFSEGRKKDLYKNEIQQRIIQKAYDSLCTDYFFLNYTAPSFKSSMFGVIGNYMGYAGYYNPFSGEAQVNDNMPVFLLPFTSAHEVAHQLGYAKESEANFIAYLASIHSSDSSFKYSANLEMFLYANAAYNMYDSVDAKKIFKRLSNNAKTDLREYKIFIYKYQGPIDQFTTKFYTKFLHLNNQPEGMQSYSRVVFWLYNFYLQQGSRGLKK